LAPGPTKSSESVSLPQKIIEAKKIFPVNDADYQPSFEKVYGWFKKWGRYDLVDSEGSADLRNVLSDQQFNTGHSASLERWTVGFSDVTAFCSAFPSPLLSCYFCSSSSPVDDD
jgi:hypothetical protein